MQEFPEPWHGRPADGAHLLEERSLREAVECYLVSGTVSSQAIAWSAIADGAVDGDCDAVVGSMSMLAATPGGELGPSTAAIRATRLFRQFVRMHRPSDPRPPVPKALASTLTLPSAVAALRAAEASGRLAELRTIAGDAATVPRSDRDGPLVAEQFRALGQIRDVLDGHPASSGVRPELDGTAVDCPVDDHPAWGCEVCGDRHVVAATEIAWMLLADGAHDDLVDQSTARIAAILLPPSGGVVPPWDAPTLWRALSWSRHHLDRRGRDLAGQVATRSLPALAAARDRDRQLIDAVVELC